MQKDYLEQLSRKMKEPTHTTAHQEQEDQEDQEEEQQEEAGHHHFATTTTTTRGSQTSSRAMPIIMMAGASKTIHQQRDQTQKQNLNSFLQLNREANLRNVPVPFALFDEVGFREGFSCSAAASSSTTTITTITTNTPLHSQSRSHDETIQPSPPLQPYQLPHFTSFQHYSTEPYCNNPTSSSSSSSSSPSTTTTAHIVQNSYMLPSTPHMDVFSPQGQPFVDCSPLQCSYHQHFQQQQISVSPAPPGVDQLSQQHIIFQPHHHHPELFLSEVEGYQQELLPYVVPSSSYHHHHHHHLSGHAAALYPSHQPNEG